ncbi:MAG: hypothetical protein LIP02_00775 [Bacteroidales bacterium]|nr:hypothetical protein [Bacteroidales bacterium]
MKKQLLMALGACCLFGAASAQRYVYVQCDFQNWVAPTEANASAFEDYKIYETADGSNIYDGVVSGTSWSSSQGIRFFTDFSSEDYSWNEHQICPPQQETLEGNGAVYKGSGATYHTYTSNPTCWVLPTQASSFRVRLDMNTGEVAIAPGGMNPAIVVNEDQAPDIMEASTLPLRKKATIFVPAGPCEFFFYNYSTGVKLSPLEGAETITSASTTISNFNTDQGNWTIPNWTGGVLTFWGSELTVDGNVPKHAGTYDKLYLPGEFADWWFDEDYVLTPEGTAYTGTLSSSLAGSQFKIGTGFGWDYTNFGVTGKTRTDGDVTYYELSTSGSNITLPEYGDDVALLVDGVNWNLAMWPASKEGPASTEILFDASSQEAPVGQLYLVTSDSFLVPSKDNINYIFSYLTALTPNGDGSWRGSAWLNEGQKLAFYDADRDSFICPGSDVDINFQNKEAFSRYTTSTADALSYWVNGEATTATITVSASGDNYDAVHFELPGAGEELSCIYLVGQPEGWAGPSASTQTHYDSWRLEETTDGGYYGAFDINAGEAMFRFYASLTDWDTDSYGCQSDDYPIEYGYTSGTETLDLVKGKGSFSFPYWPGGTMYMYVSISGGIFRVSDSPMDVTIGASESKSKIYAITDDGAYPLSYQSDGVFSGSVIRSSSTDLELRIASKLIGVAPDQPEYIGSYTFDAPEALTALDFDKFGVAEATISGNGQQVSATPANAFVLPKYQSGINRSYVKVTVDLNEHKVYVDGQSVYFLAGGITNGVYPTFDNRYDFDGLTMPYMGYGMFDIPEGKFDFQICQINDGQYTNQAEVPFNEEGVADSNDVDWNYGFYYKQLSCPSWTGGKVLILGGSKMLDMSHVDKIYQVVNDGEQDVFKEISPVSEGSQVYEFTTTLTKNSQWFPYVAMYLKTDYTFLLGSPITFDGTGGSYDYSLCYVTLGDEPVTLGIGNQNSYRFPTVTENTVKVRVDLDNLTTTFTVLDGDLDSPYTVFSNEGNDGVVLYPSSAESGMASGTVAVTATDEPIEINFGGLDNTVLVPSGGDVEVAFDQSGIFTGPFSTVDSSSTARRLKAQASSKWILPAGLEGNLTVLIDENKSQITMLAASQSKTYFVHGIQSDPDYAVARIDTFRDQVITLNDRDTYTGEVEIPATGLLTVFNGYTTSNYPDGPYGRSYSMSEINLTQLDQTVELPLSEYTGTWYWTLNNAEYYVAWVEYDPVMLTLSFTSTAISGVENVIVDNDQNAPVEYYNLQGIRVANPTPGQIYIRRQGNTVTKIIIK